MMRIERKRHVYGVGMSVTINRKMGWHWKLPDANTERNTVQVHSYYTQITIMLVLVWEIFIVRHSEICEDG